MSRKLRESWHGYVAEQGHPELVHANVYEFDGRESFDARTDLDDATIFPDTRLREDESARILRSASFGRTAVYSGGFFCNGHAIPFGMFAASSLERDAVDIRRIELPDDAKPWDLMVRNGKVYVLLDSPAEERHLIRVIASPDLRKWVEVLRFRAPTFARSFELLDGDFYFGLGCEIADPYNWTVEELHADTGEILRIRGGQ